MSKTDLKMVFFGGEPLGVPVLEKLKAANLSPERIVCNPDRPQGRKRIMTPPPVKVWAEAHEIPVLQPDSLKDEATYRFLAETEANLFVVVAYSNIVPKRVLDIPKHGALNAHPSLLPKFRGPSPIRSAILADERETGATIILLDEKIDHGPILAQRILQIPEDEWPMTGGKLDAQLAELSGELLAETIPKWIAGDIKPHEQNHADATFTKKISKADGELDLSIDPYTNLLKICAFDGWPGTYFFREVDGRRTRIKITDAELEKNGSLKILRVIPEGKREMDYDDFSKSITA